MMVWRLSIAKINMLKAIVALLLLTSFTAQYCDAKPIEQSQAAPAELDGLAERYARLYNHKVTRRGGTYLPRHQRFVAERAAHAEAVRLVELSGECLNKITPEDPQFPGLCSIHLATSAHALRLGHYLMAEDFKASTYTNASLQVRSRAFAHAVSGYATGADIPDSSRAELLGRAAALLAECKLPVEAAHLLESVSDEQIDHPCVVSARLIIYQRTGLHDPETLARYRAEYEAVSEGGFAACTEQQKKEIQAVVNQAEVLNDDSDNGFKEFVEIQRRLKPLIAKAQKRKQEETARLRALGFCGVCKGNKTIPRTTTVTWGSGASQTHVRSTPCYRCEGTGRLPG